MPDQTVNRQNAQRRPLDVNSADAQRLERLWSGSFGRAYTRRNDTRHTDVGAFHHALCTRLAIRSVLEVGCNVGLNLMRVAEDETIAATGVDVNEDALATARRRMPRCTFVRASAYTLPLAAESFDLVFTCGVLIHIPVEDLPAALAEIHRTSRRYIWAGEYYSPTRVEVPYRRQRRALFKDDFGRRYQEQFPGLTLIETGFLDRVETGFDNLTWWLFEKRQAYAEQESPPAAPAH